MAKRPRATGRRRPSRRKILLALGYYRYGLHKGVARYAREAGWVLHAGMSRGNRAPMWWRGDGIIALNSGRADIYKLLQTVAVPTVELGENAKMALPQMLPDNAAIARLVAEHFISRGFEHISFLRILDNWHTRELIPVFKEAVEAAGRQYICLDWPKAARAAGIGRSMRDAWLADELRALPKPVAIMGQTDQQVLRVLRVCEDIALRVPEEVAVVGIENDELRCELTHTPLSSVDCDDERIGYEAARLLDGIIDGQAPPAEPIRIPPKGLVIRKSSDTLAIRHREAATALSFIWDHYREPITANDVADCTAMSRRRLHDVFVRHVGHSIRDEIMRLRLRDAQEMLRETDSKVKMIAQSCGFTSAESMCRAFRRAIGKGPRAYRGAYRRGGQRPQ